MLNVCVSSPVTTALVEIWSLLYVKCLCELSHSCYMLNVCVCCPVTQPSSRGLLYVKCLCGLSRYHNPVRGPRYHSPVVEVCCMLCVFASCPAITAK